MFSAISAIATLTHCGMAIPSTDWIWLLFFTAVPLLLVCLGGRPTPTRRQVSSGGPPPQVLRDPGQPQINPTTKPTTTSAPPLTIHHPAVVIPRDGQQAPHRQRVDVRLECSCLCA